MTSAQYRPAEEAPYGILIEEDLIDDSTGIIPMAGLKTPLSLKDRFARRLSKILGAEVDIRETPTSSAIDIYLSRSRNFAQPSVGLDNELRKLVRAMEDALAMIAKHAYSPQHVHKIARDKLWDVILIFNKSKIDAIIQNLKQAFQDHQKTFDDLVTRMFGIDDPENGDSMLDRELGDRVISLSQQIHSFDSSMKERNLLVRSASEMTRVLLHLQDRLRSLLEKTRFANKLFELICTLGYPERIHSTLVRSARASQAFENVTFHLRPNSPGKTVSFATPMDSSTQLDPAKPTSLPQPQGKSKRLQRFEAAATKLPVVTPTLPLPLLPPSPPSAVSSLGPLMTAVQPYLARGDRDLALSHLQPAAKQETAQLIGTILQKKLLPMQTSAWFAFGFVTTKDEDEEQQLAGLYMALLREADNSEVIFRELQTALEENALVARFDKHEYGHFRDLFPYLETFLTTPPEQRSTVWRLRQFMKDPADDEPPACLQRDYGFKFCRQREEVIRLKDIYTRMLRKLGPKNLHTACVHGRLSETAVKEDVDVDQKDRRFLQNDYGSPFLGLDNEGGLEAYRGPFYRKKLKL